MQRLSVIFAAMLLLCGCLPTPETDAVVNRGEEDLFALIQTTPAPDAVTVKDAIAALPQRANAEAGCIAGRLLLTEETNVGGAALAFDADVIVPDLDRWAVYAIERDAWSAEQRLTILNAAADGSQICAPGMYLHADKAYWEGVLKALENSERVHELDRSRAENGEQTWTESVMEYYRAAPQRAERIPFDETGIRDAEPIDAFWFEERMDAYLDFRADTAHVRLSVFDRQIVPEGAGPAGRRTDRRTLSDACRGDRTSAGVSFAHRLCGRRVCGGGDGAAYPRVHTGAGGDRPAARLPQANQRRRGDRTALSGGAFGRNICRTVAAGDRRTVH